MGTFSVKPEVEILGGGCGEKTGTLQQRSNRRRGGAAQANLATRLRRGRAQRAEDLDETKISIRYACDINVDRAFFCQCIDALLTKIGSTAHDGGRCDVEFYFHLSPGKIS
ncbi:hypothetical protein GCM10009075_25410 [Sphingomonas trueperi]